MIECPICGSSNTSEVQTTDLVTNEVKECVTCHDCTALFMKEPPDETPKLLM